MIKSPAQLYAKKEHQSFAFTGDGKSPSALLVHGFTGTPYEMYDLGTTLNAQGWTTACDLMPGFGKNIDKLAETSHTEWLDTVREHWLKIQPTNQPTVLIGFSAGGAIATCIAAESPPDYLVLIAPFTRINHPLDPLIPFAQYVKSDYLPYEDADFSDPVLRQQLTDLVEGDVDLDDPDVQAEIRASVRLPMAALSEVRRLGQLATKAAARVRCPVLIIQGADDPVVTAATTRQLVMHIAGKITYHEIPGDHHVGHYPENVLGLIQQFIRTDGYLTEQLKLQN